jgi:hypothetical protein
LQAQSPEFKSLSPKKKRKKKERKKLQVRKLRSKGWQGLNPCLDLPLFQLGEDGMAIA